MTITQLSDITHLDLVLTVTVQVNVQSPV